MHLKELYLADCELLKISHKIGQLQNLEVLDLRYNINLKYVPEGIRELKKLKILYMHNTALPQEERDCLKEWLPNTAIYY